MHCVKPLIFFFTIDERDIVPTEVPQIDIRYKSADHKNIHELTAYM